MAANQNHPWWKEAVAYQIYPKSFADSNGDGVGDLPGIIDHLDYLKTLGVDLLWLNPIYASPDVDNGYDISDYQAIDPRYGTMDDFERLLAEAHRRGMKVILDLVINHTSDRHPWFIESRQSKENPYRDFYIWRDGRDGREPNNWGAHFTRSAWTLDARTGQYYLHTFSPQQPDLNWQNPTLRGALQCMICWWLDKGIDGFRLDAISFIAKAPGLPDHPGGAPYIFHRDNMMNGPEYHPYLHELYQEAFGSYDVVTVGECIGLTVESAIEVSAPERQELNMPFLFEHTNYYMGHGKDPHALREILERWQTGLHGKGWIGLAFNSHDLPRVVNLFGDPGEYREASAKLLATLMLTLEGTPFLYQGEEIGMTNAIYGSIEELNDLAALNLYRERVAAGVNAQAAFVEARSASRDGSRSPFQWTAGQNAGFSSGKPWLGVNPNYVTVNAEEALQDPGSVFHYYRRMIELRKKTPALIYGEFVLRDPAIDGVIVFNRALGDEAYEVILNLADQPRPFHCLGELVIGNYTEPASESLQPYEARVYRLK